MSPARERQASRGNPGITAMPNNFSPIAGGGGVEGGAGIGRGGGAVFSGWCPPYDAKICLRLPWYAS
jgi:hypothetical protein